MQRLTDEISLIERESNDSLLTNKNLNKMKHLTQAQREVLINKLNKIINNENVNMQVKKGNEDLTDLCDIDTHLNDVLIEVINKTLIQNSLSINIDIQTIN